MSDGNQRRAAPLQEWQRDAIVATEPRGFMRDVVKDARRVSQSASMIPDRQRSNERPRQPSGGTVPIQQPPGLRWVDALIDAQDKLDRAHAVRVRADLIEAELSDKTSRKVVSDFDPFDRRCLGHDDDE